MKESPLARSLVLIVGLAVLLPACASTRVASPGDCALMGAMIGGLGGAAGGAEHASNRDDGQGVTIGIAGVLVGAGLGYLGCALFLDEEPEVVAVVEPEVAAPPAPVSAPVPVPDPCEEIVQLDIINFDSDRAQLTPNGMTLLEWIAEHLNKCPSRRVRIEGHTDATGSDGYNQRLSEGRAESVSTFLTERGVDAARLTSQGFGESRPVTPNATREGRVRNRRVELIPID